MSPRLLLLDGDSTPPPPFPPAPSRARVCSVQLAFQGLTAPLAAGSVPWFEAALACLSPADRLAVYAAKHLAGDTHALIMFTAGGPLYPEPNQPYEAYQLPDYEHDPAAFVALVREVILAGFFPCIFFTEAEADSMRLMPKAIAALRGATPDLTAYCLLVPGFDGVFYGWDPLAITAWGHAALAAGARYLGLEFSAGHIPLGGGPADYAPGGAMAPFAVLLGEFDLWPTLTDVEFQILGRLLGPAYIRPPQQPAGDDPHPPFYLAGSSTLFVVFEYGTYGWVRGWYTPAQMQAAKAWYQACGATLVC